MEPRTTSSGREPVNTSSRTDSAVCGPPQSRRPTPRRPRRGPGRRLRQPYQLPVRGRCPSGRRPRLGGRRSCTGRARGCPCPAPRGRPSRAQPAGCGPRRRGRIRRSADPYGSTWTSGPSPPASPSGTRCSATPTTGRPTPEGSPDRVRPRTAPTGGATDGHLAMDSAHLLESRPSSSRHLGPV